MATQSLAERINKAREKAKREAAKLQQLESQASEQRRKAETRAKIVIGGTVISAMDRDPAFKSQVVDLLRQHVTREIDAKAVATWLQPT